MANTLWNTLSAIDCSDYVEKKGQFSYLAWTYAWAIVKENYPLAKYKLLKDRTFDDGTMEVRVKVTIPYNLEVEDGEVVVHEESHTMWLPVLDFKNKPIQCPNAFDINTSRMRCLVKCLAMFGLGHYIYAGESLPAPPADLQDRYEEMLSLVANSDHWNLRKFTETHKAHMDNLFNMAPDGKKTKFKNDVRALYAKGNEQIKKNVAILEDAVNNPDSEYRESIAEVFDEMDVLEREYTMLALDEVLKTKLLEMHP